MMGRSLSGAAHRSEPPGVDISKIPDEVKNTKIAMSPPESTISIAIGEDGKIYGWGNEQLGQYGRKEEFA